MSKFAKGINSNNAKALTKKIFFKLNLVVYSLPSVSWSTLELLAVTDFLRYQVFYVKMGTYICAHAWIFSLNVVY